MIPNNHTKDIRQIYTNSKSTTVTTNKSGKMILAAIQPKSKPKFKKQFKEECHLCGVKGHEATDCSENDKTKEKLLDTPFTFQNTQKISLNTVIKKVNQ
jgi:hypothetical protein